MSVTSMTSITKRHVHVRHERHMSVTRASQSSRASRQFLLPHDRNEAGSARETLVAHCLANPTCCARLPRSNMLRALHLLHTWRCSHSKDICLYICFINLSDEPCPNGITRLRDTSFFASSFRITSWCAPYLNLARRTVGNNNLSNNERQSCFFCHNKSLFHLPFWNPFT